MTHGSPTVAMLVALSGIFLLDWNEFIARGVMGFFAQNVGLRGDVRYFRGFRGSSSDTVTGLALSDFHFWRGSIGVTFKF